MACKTCRLRKVKCSREHPRCKNCATRSLDCVYEGERVKRRRLNESESNNTQIASPTESRPLFQQTAPLDGSNDVSGSLSSNSGMREYTGDMTEPSGSYLSPVSTNSCITVENSQTKNPDGQEVHPVDLLDQILEQDPQSMPANRSPSVWIRTEVGDEYTGPSSGISIISDQGLSLLRRRVKKCGCLSNIFKQLRSTLLNHLRQPKCMGPGLWSKFQVHGPQRDLPSWDTMQEYIDAYFSEVQVHFPVLNRAIFEAELMSFKSGQAQDNPSWKALLYAVLASGCRAALSDETPAAFQRSANEAWSYFVSALSYEAMLVHVATDLTAVQTLAVMTVFAQGMSSPQRVEFTLCSTAVRLAFSLAMNCAPPAQWNLTESEKEERNRTFWVVYCLDKTLALRCGRPSAINDAEISCEFPKGTVGSSAAPASLDQDGQPLFDFFLCVTKYARICGRISRELYSAFALSRYCSDLTQPATQLLKDLQTWRATLPATRFRQSHTERGEAHAMSKAQLVFLQLSYYYALCSIYRRFGPIFCQVDEDENKAQASLTGVIPTSQMEAARSMVLLTKHIDVESYSPGWLVFYQPMTALLTIFLNLVCQPTDISAAHDIALMEVAVGFFGRLEYITSGEAGFTQVTEFVRQARFIVNKSAQDLCRCVPEETEVSEHLCHFPDRNRSCVEAVHSRAGNVLESQMVQQETVLPTESERANQGLHLDVQNFTVSSDGVNFDLCTTPEAAPLAMMSGGLDTNTVSVELPHLGATGYDEWLDSWLSPSELDLSGRAWLA